jgi:hypothetical protein
MSTILSLKKYTRNECSASKKNKPESIFGFKATSEQLNNSKKKSEALVGLV